MGALHLPRRSLLSANQDITPAALPPLRRHNPREEPGALAALAGIWAGGDLLIVLTCHPAITVLSTGYRPLGSCSRAAGWSAATSCYGPRAEVCVGGRHVGFWG